MRVPRRTRVGLTIVGGLLTASCHDVLSVPPRLSATYVLQSIDGRALPTTAAEGGGQRYVVVADSLVFEASGKVRRSYTVRWISSWPSSLDTTYHQTLVLPYSTERGRVMIGSRRPCPPNATCVGWEEGTIDASFVRLTARLLWPGEPEFLFRRR